MVSEMRARVRNLEQKIHTHVPRKRKGEETKRQARVIKSVNNALIPTKFLEHPHNITVIRDQIPWPLAQDYGFQSQGFLEEMEDRHDPKRRLFCLLRLAIYKLRHPPLVSNDPLVQMHQTPITAN
jgi:hypothetical protein